MKFLILLLLFGIHSMALSQTIVNGSFEEWPDSCAVNTPPFGWTNFSSNTNGPDQRGIYCSDSRTPIDGNHYMGLYGCAGSAITREGSEQHLTGLITGDYYTVSFYAIAGDSVYYGVDLSVYAYLDSVMVFESAPILKTDPWKQFQFSFQATSTEVDLAFMTTDWGNYCSLASIGIDLVTIVKGVSVSEDELLDFALFPNPATERLFLNSSHPIDTEVEILDLNGAIITSALYTNQGIDVSYLETGMYFIRLKNELYRARRFIKR